jgi:hypothetical protein
MSQSLSVRLQAAARKLDSGQLSGRRLRFPKSDSREALGSALRDPACQGLVTQSFGVETRARLERGVPPGSADSRGEHRRAVKTQPPQEQQALQRIEYETEQDEPEDQTSHPLSQPSTQYRITAQSEDPSLARDLEVALRSNVTEESLDPGSFQSSPLLPDRPSSQGTLKQQRPSHSKSSKPQKTPSLVDFKEPVTPAPPAIDGYISELETWVKKKNKINQIKSKYQAVNNLFEIQEAD